MTFDNAYTISIHCEDPADSITIPWPSCSTSVSNMNRGGGSWGVASIRAIVSSAIPLGGLESLSVSVLSHDTGSRLNGRE